MTHRKIRLVATTVLLEKFEPLYHTIIYLPLRASILRVPSSESQLSWPTPSQPLANGRYSQPVVMSGSQLAEVAAGEPFLSQPYG